MTDLPPRLVEALAERYRIERPLGEGGMATVYLADDLKHKRKVAIKVLKPELAAVLGGERFLTEIQTTANLQHPHILPLFDSGEADSFLYYVMPYVEGESLRDRLDRDKQLPVDDAVRLAVAVASALDYAHRQGVIHRDIKPANILLQDGQPVVADFGIALAVSAAGGGRLTETGLSLGTPHYMSPEQATADRELNAQSDVYALACVTYEMLTGGPPFSAPTAQAVLMQILTEDAKPVTAVRKSVPVHVERALEKALEKLPADRFTSAEAFGRALRDPGATEARRAVSVPGRGSASTSPLWVRIAWPAIALVFLAVAIQGWMRPAPPSQPVNRLLLSTPNESGESQILSYISISPDGQHIAYQAQDPSGAYGLYVRDLSEFEARRALPGQIIATFSHDSERLAVLEGTTLGTVDLNGGALTTLTDNVWPFSPIEWSSDGYIYFTDPDGRPMRVGGAGQTPEPVNLDPSFDELLAVLDVLEAHNGAMAFSGIGEVGFLDFETGVFHPLLIGSIATGAWVLADQFLIWQDGGDLIAQRFDPSIPALEGSPVVIAREAALDANTALVDFADSGTGVYVTTIGQRDEDEPDLIEITRTGMRTQTDAHIGTSLGLHLSPDGQRIVYEERIGAGNGDIYVYDLANGNRQRLTFDGDAAYPVWAPSGDRVAYYRVIDGEYATYTRNADGSGVEEVLLDAPISEIEVEFLPSGEQVLIRSGDQRLAQGSDIHLYTVGDPESASPIATEPGNQLGPRVSPDGRYVAYTSDELNGILHVFVRSIEDPRQRWQLSDDQGGTEATWNADGTEVFYRRSGSLVSVPVTVEPSFVRLGEPQPLFETRGLLTNPNHTAYAPMPDGESFLFVEFGRGLETRIVINWIEEIRERLGGSD